MWPRQASNSWCSLSPFWVLRQSMAIHCLLYLSIWYILSLIFIVIAPFSQNLCYFCNCPQSPQCFAYVFFFFDNTPNKYSHCCWNTRRSSTWKWFSSLLQIITNLLCSITSDCQPFFFFWSFYLLMLSITLVFWWDVSGHTDFDNSVVMLSGSLKILLLEKY